MNQPSLITKIITMANKWKRLSVNETTTLGMFMDHANYHKEIHMRDKAFLSLIDIKQDMIDNEDYDIAIPFIVYS